MAGIAYLSEREKKKAMAYCLMTDLKPADMVAMGVLNGRKIVPHSIIVGEGNVENKLIRMSLYKDHLSWIGNICTGIPSTKIFLSELNLVPHHYRYRLFDAKPLAMYSFDAIICLKPPRELCNLYKEDPEKTRKGFKNKQLFICDLSNLRCITDEEGWESISWMFKEDTPFKEVVIYEPYLSMPRAPSSSLSPDTFPEFWSRLDERTDDFVSDLKSCMRVWDDDVMKECFQTMEECEKEGMDNDEAKVRYRKNKTYFDEVKIHKGRQFALPHPVLATVFDDPEFESCKIPIQVEYSKPYVVRRRTSMPTKVFMYANLPYPETVSKMTEYFHHL